LKKFNQRASVTIDFIFGITIVAGVSFILLGLCLTMAVVEVSQYVAFATSRTYFGSHLNEEEQIKRAEAKFDKLIKNRSLKNILNGDWYNVSHIQTGDLRNFYPPQNLDHDSDTFFGTRISLNAKVLNIRIPLLGSSEGEGEGEGYVSYLNSFLGREPNFDECMNFTKQRWARFVSRFPLQNSSNQSADGVYAVIADNGC